MPEVYRLRLDKELEEEAIELRGPGLLISCNLSGMNPTASLRVPRRLTTIKAIVTRTAFLGKGLVEFEGDPILQNFRSHFLQ